MDGGEHPIALRQQAMEHQQGQGRLCRVGVYNDVAESTEVLVTLNEIKGGKRVQRPNE